MYNPVVQRRRARSDRLSSNSSEDTECLEERPALLSPGDSDTEALEMTTQKPKFRKRKGNLTRRRRMPIRKPSWDDCTIIRPQKKTPGLNNLTLGRTMMSGRGCPRYHSKLPLRTSQGVRGKKVRTGGVGDGWGSRRKPTLTASKEFNLNNQRRLSCVNCSCQRKKTVAFHPEPVTCAQVYYPDKSFQRSKAKPNKSCNTAKETSWCRPIIKSQRPACCKSGCCQMASDCRPVTNSRSHNSALHFQPRSLNKERYSGEGSTSRQADRCTSDKRRLTNSESKAFKYLAKRLLDKDLEHPPMITAQVHESFGKRNPSDGTDHVLESPVLDTSPHQYPGRAVGVWDSPDCLQHPRRSKSRSPKNTYNPPYTPRSKSLSNFKFSDGVKKLVPRGPSIARDSVGACTKAMSNLQLKERELIERYGLSPSETSIDFETDWFLNKKLNADIARPWDSQLLINDGYHLGKGANLYNNVHTNNSYFLKKPCSWNPSSLERNFSQNRYTGGPARVRTPLGTPDGFFRHYTPPSNLLTGNSGLPWSSVLRTSGLQPRPASCAAVRLISKYLEDDGVTDLARGRKTSTSPRRRSSQVAVERNNSQTEGESQAKPNNTPPWRKIEGATDRIGNDYKLDKAPDVKVPSGWSTHGAFQNCLGGGSWRRGATNTGSFSSDFASLGRMLSKSLGGGKAAPGVRGNTTSLGGINFSLDRLGGDAIHADRIYNKGLPFPSTNTACKFLTPDACVSQTASPSTSQPTTSGKMSTPVSDWQTGKAPGFFPVDSCLKEEEERLRRIGFILG